MHINLDRVISYIIQIYIDLYVDIYEEDSSSITSWLSSL